MKFIGFNFNKISVERFSNSLEGLKINTKIDISDIKDVKESFTNKDIRLIKAEFQYDVIYDPGFANITLSGEVFVSDKSDVINEIIKKWEKDKSMPDDFKVFLFNIVLRKCNLKSLELEEEMNLPLHLPLPLVRKENQKKE